MHGKIRDPWQGLRANLLLQSLSAADALALAPLLTRIHLRAGERLGLAQGGEALVYFPETLIACLGTTGDDRFEVGMVGREGAIGCEALLGGGSVRYTARAQLGGGSVLVVGFERLSRICVARATMMEALLRFSLLFSVQMAGTLVSNAHDTLETRLSRWLLMFHDRMDGDELVITHDSLGSLLNARRASVTDALHLLEGDLVLRCTRGRVRIRDREALEARAAHAYGPAERSYHTAIGPFGKSSIAAIRST